jgi:hypothetical protein
MRAWPCPRADTPTVVYELSQHSLRVSDCDESVVWQSRLSPQRHRVSNFVRGDQSAVHPSSDGHAAPVRSHPLQTGGPYPCRGLCQHCILHLHSIDPATEVEQRRLSACPGVRDMEFEICIVSVARNSNVAPRCTDRGRAPLFNMHESVSSTTSLSGGLRRV